MDYLLLKTLHVTCVAVTFTLFFGRGVLMFMDSPLLKARVLRIAPHVNDTLLLGSAIWMAAVSRQYPFAEAWLTAKLLALMVYIGAGMIALSYGRTRRVRVAAWLVALLVFAYIVGVALTRSAAPMVWVWATR
jgi:uncharacterized membrane protein SirB2